MHPRILAERKHHAQEKLAKCAREISEALGLSYQAEKLNAQRSRDLQVAELEGFEAVADLLEAIAQTLEHEKQAGFDFEVRLATIGYRIAEDGQFVAVERVDDREANPELADDGNKPTTEPPAVEDPPPAEEKTGKGKGKTK